MSQKNSILTGTKKLQMGKNFKLVLTIDYVYFAGLNKAVFAFCHVKNFLCITMKVGSLCCFPERWPYSDQSVFPKYGVQSREK
jgi:hypothetical protein